MDHISLIPKLVLGCARKNLFGAYPNQTYKISLPACL